MLYFRILHFGECVQVCVAATRAMYFSCAWSLAAHFFIVKK